MARASLLALTLLTLLAAPALAGGPAAGQEAPDAGVDGEWLHEPPVVRSVRELRGDVVVVLAWNVGDLEAARTLGSVAALHEPEDGVHVLSFVSTGDRELILDRLRAGQIRTLAVSVQGAEAYQADFLPYAWVVGVDGTIAFAGAITEPKLMDAVKDEKKKVRYPGLGRVEFDKAVHKALDKYKKSDLEAARKEAQKVVDDAKASEAAKADAADLLARLTRIGLGQRRRAEYYESYPGRQSRGLVLWEEIADRWKKEPEGVFARQRVDQLSKDPQLIKERNAEKAWRALEKQLRGKTNEEQVKMLAAFYNDPRYKDTMAQREVRAVHDGLISQQPPGGKR